MTLVSQGQPAASMATTPSQAFLAAWLGDPDEAQRGQLASRLDELARAIAEAWPAGVPAAVPLAGFFAELARCLPEGTADADLDRALAAVHAVDLYLAFACRRGDAGALARFERECVAPLDPVIARVDGTRTFVDEVKQRVRLKLLVSDDGEPPRLAHYAGRGPLRAWLRVVVVREALTLVRAQRRAPALDDDEVLALEAADSGPELGLLKQHWHGEFVAAFQCALGELEASERNLLRLHYLHGLSIDELGKLLGVHRSSAARRIVRTREALLAATRRALLAKMAVGRQDFDQLMALVASRLDLSIERFLAARDTQGAAG
jgi:RNA polymerase sigma-70 factor (ECF subfamily)